MKRAVMMLLCGSTLIACAALKASNADDSHPYHGIVARNVFNLKDPPPPPQIVPPPAPAPKITLNGIFTILGKKQVALKVAFPPRPPEPAREESYILSEGEREGVVEIVQIDVTAGTVKVKNSGNEQELNFDDHGAKPTAAASPRPAPIAQPVLPPPPVTIPSPAPTAPTVPRRPPRLPISAAAQAPGQNAQVVSPYSPNGSYSYSHVVVQPQGQPRERQVDPAMAQQIIMMEYNRELTKEAVLEGRLPPLPPTVLTPPDGVTGRRPPQPNLTIPIPGQ